MGAGKLLRVMGGDKLHVKVDYYTPDVTTSNPGPNGLTTVINSLLSVINGNNSFDPIKGEGSAITTSLNGSSVFTSFLSPQSTSQGSTMPKAYLNILFFDGGRGIRAVKSAKTLIDSNSRSNIKAKNRSFISNLKGTITTINSWKN